MQVLRTLGRGFVACASLRVADFEAINFRPSVGLDQGIRVMRVQVATVPRSSAREGSKNAPARL